MNTDNQFSNQLELKLKNRFIVEFPESFNIPSYVIKGISKPTMSIKR